MKRIIASSNVKNILSSIEELVSDYPNAVSRRDMVRLRRNWPNVSDKDMNYLKKLCEIAYDAKREKLAPGASSYWDYYEDCVLDIGDTVHKIVMNIH